MIISLTNQKGGVSKTSTTANLGAGLERMGFKVLLIDWDEQGNLTRHFGVTDPDFTIIEGLLDDEKFVPYSIKEDRLMLMASDPKLSQFDKLFMDQIVGGHLVLKNKLEDLKVKEKFDFILIDCAPGQGLRNMNAYVASDFLLVPIEAHSFSKVGLEQVVSLIQELVKNKANENLNVAGIFFTRHNSKTVISRSYIDSMAEEYSDLPIYNTVIRENVNIKEASEVGKSIFDYVDEYEIVNSNGANDYYNFVLEFLEVLDIEPRTNFSLPVAKPKRMKAKPVATSSNNDTPEEAPAKETKKVRKAGKEDVAKGFKDFMKNE
ncbi:ParA family protein [Ekhidna sp.]